VPAGTIPGEYRLKAIVYDAGSAQPLGAALDLGSVTIDHAAPQDAAAADLPEIGVSLAGLRLEAASVPSSGITPGDRAPITLLWSGSRTAQPAHVQIAVGGVSENHVAGGERYPTTAWQSPDLVRDVVSFRVPPSLAAGVYPVRVNGVGAGSLRVLPVERSFSAPPLAHPVQARFGNVLELLGYDAQPGPSGLHVRLIWQALGETSISYTVFVHALGSDGRITGQADVPPGTDRWVKGQVVATSYDIPRADRLEVGLYDADSGKRLPVCCAGADSIMLDTIQG
jgi:hypothetical protein